MRKLHASSILVSPLPRPINMILDLHRDLQRHCLWQMAKGTMW